MNTKFFISVSWFLILLVSPTVASAQNVLLFTFDDSGPNVTATVTGSFDTSGLNSIGQAVPSVPNVSQDPLSFGTTTATSTELFGDVYLNGSPLSFLPFLANFPVRGSIVTPLSEYLAINIGIVEGDGPSVFAVPYIGLAEGETIFNADALENNVIVFQESSLEDLGASSFLSLTPTTVLTGFSGENAIQFVLGSSEIMLGDVNQDGVVSFDDVDPFIEVLLAEGFLAEADCNQDGEVNFLDVFPFVEILVEQ